MDTIKQNIAELRKFIPQTVDLVCVSKFHSVESILQAYDCGERLFGESRVQELVRKYNDLPKDIKWHFIGHLQRNKAKDIINKIDCLHSLDSLNLAKIIDEKREKILKEIDRLEAQARKEKQPKKKYELVEIINRLKKEIGEDN